LTVQTLLSVFVVVVLLIAGFLLLRGRAPGWECMRLSGVAFVVGDIVFMSAAIWYATRGTFDESWAFTAVPVTLMVALLIGTASACRPTVVARGRRSC
jgi:hypothetical protein